MNKGTGKFGIRRSKENHVFNKQNKQKKHVAIYRKREQQV